MIPLVNFQTELRRRIIGQNEAIDIFSVVVYKYLLKLYARDSGCYFNSPTSTILIGPSGCGKTHIVRETSNLLDIPFIEINAKSISQEGWSGKSFVDLLESGLQEESRKFERAINGCIVFIDEFDKLMELNYSSKGDNVNFHLQASILKYIEGFEFGIVRNRFNTANYRFNTCNCLFVFAGAFSHLKLYDEKPIIGFTHTKEEKENVIKKLVDFGMLPEIAGRIQEYCILNKITEEDYKRLLKSEYFHLDKWRKVLEKLDIAMKIDENPIIEHALLSDLGVRGLIQAVEKEVTKAINSETYKVDLEKFSPLFVKKP